MTSQMNDLYAYNDWANGKVLSLCEGLTDEQLDAPREMGFGTLRATLFHILTAEIIWMERWQGVAWRPFPTDPQGASLADIRDGLRDVADRRSKLIAAHASDQWNQRVKYQDSKQDDYEQDLFPLLLHVANHGVHHRAQALNYLKQYDRTVVAGIDYAFYRLATHSVPQTDEAVEGLTGFGLEVSEPTDDPCPYDPAITKRLYAYHDWATGQVLDFAADVSGSDLDRDFNMGPGSIRKTLLHMFDAETWWLKNWMVGPNDFPQSDEGTTIAQLREQWSELAAERNQFVGSVDATEAQRIIEILAGGPPTRFKVGESTVHVAIHGTHHRAQLINMYRHVGAPWRNIDLMYAIDQL